MKVKICFYAKLCTQNEILASKMRNLKQKNTCVFTTLILKRWIGRGHFPRNYTHDLEFVTILHKEKAQRLVGKISQIVILSVMIHFAAILKTFYIKSYPSSDILNIRIFLV